MDAFPFATASGRTGVLLEAAVLFVLAVLLVQSGGPVDSVRSHWLPRLRQWWAEQRASIAGLAVWALAVGAVASCNPLDATRQDLPYRVEATEGAVFMMRAASVEACQADATAHVLCTGAVNEP